MLELFFVCVLFVFFFKQKTAYEMRISDWSSDVCSSDLRIDVARADYYPNISLSALVGFQSLGLGNLFDAGSKYGNGGAAISLPVFDGGRIEGRPRGARADSDAAVATSDTPLIAAPREIGSVSCREGVCQYVEISVVAS